MLQNARVNSHAMKRTCSKQCGAHECYLPSLASLALNFEHTGKPPRVFVDAPKRVLDGDDSTGGGGRKYSKEGKTNDWVLFDPTDHEKHKFNVRQLEDTFFDKNKEWRKWYPSPNAGAGPRDKWTSVYPDDVNTFENPHWLQPDWKSLRHESLSEARQDFVSAVKKAVKDADKQEALEELEAIMINDGNESSTKKLEESLSKIAQLFQDKLRAVNLEVPPPGFLVWHFKTGTDDQPTQKVYNELVKNEGRIGKYQPTKSKWYGPRWCEWTTDKDNQPVMAKSLSTAWLIYMGYVKSDYAWGEAKKKLKKHDQVRPSDEPLDTATP